MLPRQRRFLMYTLSQQDQNVLARAVSFHGDPHVNTIIDGINEDLSDIAEREQRIYFLEEQLHAPPFGGIWLHSPPIYVYPLALTVGGMIARIHANTSDAFNTGSSALSLAQNARGFLSSPSSGGIPPPKEIPPIRR